MSYTCEEWWKYVSNAAQGPEKMFYIISVTYLYDRKMLTNIRCHLWMQQS